MRTHGYHFATIAYILAATAFAQAPFYPDRYPDEDKGPTRYRENAGQVMDTHGDPVAAVKYSAEGSPLGIHLADKSTVHYTWAATYKDSTLADTTFRWT